MRIERRSGLPGGIEALSADSEQAGLHFVRKLVNGWTTGANRFDKPGEAF